MIFGIIWWALILGAADFLVLGWLVRPHSDGVGEHYWPGWSLAWAVIVTTAILWLGGFNLPVWIWQNPMNFFVGVVGYAAIGVCWSVVHWWLWRNSESQRHRLSVAFATWKSFWKAGSETATPEAFRTSSDYPYGWDSDFPMILTWALFWPLDVFFYLLGDFVFNLASAIGRKLAGIYSAIGKSIDKSVIGG